MARALRETDILIFFNDVEKKAQQLVSLLSEDYAGGRELIIKIVEYFGQYIQQQDATSIKRQYEIVRECAYPLSFYLYTQKVDNLLERRVMDFCQAAAGVLDSYYGRIFNPDVLYLFPLEVLEELAKRNPAQYRQAYMFMKANVVNALNNAQDDVIARYKIPGLEGIIDHNMKGLERTAALIKKGEKALARIDRELAIGRRELKGWKYPYSWYFKRKAAERASLKESAEMAISEARKIDETFAQLPGAVLEKIRKERTQRRELNFFVFVGSIIHKFRKNVDANMDLLNVKVKEFARKKVDVSAEDYVSLNVKKPQVSSVLQGRAQEKAKPAAAAKAGKKILKVDTGRKNEHRDVIGDLLSEKKKAGKPKDSSTRYSKDKVYEEILKKHQGQPQANANVDEDWR